MWAFPGGFHGLNDVYRHKMRKTAFGWQCVQKLCAWRWWQEAGKVPKAPSKYAAGGVPPSLKMGCSNTSPPASLHGIKLPFPRNFPARYPQSTNFANLNVKKFYLVFICISHIAQEVKDIFHLFFPSPLLWLANFPIGFNAFFLLIFRRSL